jgi:ferritin-like protein
VDAKAALMHAHRNNIRRYRRLLETHLTDAERDYIELRLSEERAVLRDYIEGRLGLCGWPSENPSQNWKRRQEL